MALETVHAVNPSSLQGTPGKWRSASRGCTPVPKKRKHALPSCIVQYVGARPSPSRSSQSRYIISNSRLAATSTSPLAACAAPRGRARRVMVGMWVEGRNWCVGGRRARLRALCVWGVWGNGATTRACGEAAGARVEAMWVNGCQPAVARGPATCHKIKAVCINWHFVLPLIGTLCVGRSPACTSSAGRPPPPGQGRAPAAARQGAPGRLPRTPQGSPPPPRAPAAPSWLSCGRRQRP